MRRRVEFLDVHRDWPAIHERFPQLSREACLTDMHGIDRADRLFAGFDTYRALAHVLPLRVDLLPLLYVPPVPWSAAACTARSPTGATPPHVRCRCARR